MPILWAVEGKRWVKGKKKIKVWHQRANAINMRRKEIRVKKRLTKTEERDIIKARL